MKTMRCLTVEKFLACLVCVGAVISAPAAEAPLLASIEIRGLNTLVEDVNRVAMGLQLGPQGALLMPVLDQALGGGGFAGIHSNGTLRVYVFGRDPQAASTRHKPVVVTLPTDDNGQQFMAGLTNSLTHGTSDGGIVRFSLPADAPFPKPDLFVGTEAGQAILSEDRALVSTVMQQLGSGRAFLGQKLDIAGTVAVDVNLVAVGDLLQKSLSKAAETMPASPAMDVNVTGVLKAQGDAVKMLLDQIDACQFGLGTDARSVVVHSRMAAKPASVMGRVFAASQPPRKEFLTALPEGLVMAQVGHMGDVDAVLDLYNDMLLQVVSNLGGEAQGVSELLRQSLSDLRGLSTGEYATGLWAKHNPPGLGYVYYLGVKDPARVQAVLDSYLTRFGDTNMVLAGMHVRVERGAQREHNGIPISAYQYHLNLGPELESAPMGAPSMLAQWTNVVSEVAFVGDICVLTTGDAAQMNASLDRLHSPGRSLLDRPSFTTLFPGDATLPQASQLFSLSLVEYAKMVVGMMPGMNAQTLAMFPATQSGLSGYSVTQGASQVSVIKLGVEELAALKSMVPFLMMGAMAHGGPGSGPMGMPPSDMDEQPEAPAEQE